MILPEHVHVAPSQISGLGVFALVPIPAGEEIEYTGPLVKSKNIINSNNRYLFQVSAHLSIDGSVPANLAGYINHSCRPNCESVPRGKQIYIRTMYDIHVGEELTYTYAPAGDLSYWSYWIEPYGCRCSGCSPVTVTKEGLQMMTPSGVGLLVKWTPQQAEKIAAWYQDPHAAPTLMNEPSSS